MRCTVGSDDLLRLFQIVPGHAWEEMMLNLVIQSTVHVVIKRVGCDITSGKNLAPQEFHLGAFFQDGHTFVIGSKGRTQVETKEHLIDKDKDYPLPEIKMGEEEDQAKVEDIVENYKDHFSHSMRGFPF